MQCVNNFYFVIYKRKCFDVVYIDLIHCMMP